MPAHAIFQDRMLSLGLARVSEAAALASARLVGSIVRSTPACNAVPARRLN